MLKRHIGLATLTTSLLAAAPALAQPTTDQPPTPTTPATQAPATVPVASTPAVVALPDAPAAVVAKPVVTSKWDATLYGFVEADTIYDSTQGLNESVGNGAVPRPNTYAGDHAQLTYGARNSRIGFKLAAPTYNDIKATAQLEMDFLGNQPTVTEAALFQNATMRFRHLNLKFETPVVDVLIGQYWELFGWQSNFHPNTVEIQGVPGQVYSRTPQIRVSKTIKTDDVTLDLAIAALRAPQRASATPDGQAGVKLTLNKLKAWHTGGGASTGLDGASFGVSGVVRHFAVDEFSATPSSQVTTNGHGISVDAIVPIIPATKENHDNALTLTASYVTGTGIADLYTGLTGNVSQPSLPNPTMASPAPTYTPNIDPGLAMFTADGKLSTVNWQSYIFGLQYYLPTSTKLFVSANYSHIESSNASDFGAASKVWTKEDWADANLFYDLTPAVRLGVEGALFDMTYADGVSAKNYRLQFSGFFMV